MALRQEEFTSLCDDVDLDRDRALVERCQAGDSAAFGNLYARYNERLLRFCLRRLNDRHEAEDAAQEAFARAWKALPNFAGERRFYPWLTVIAGNICTDMLRRRSRSTPTDDLELGAYQPLGSSGVATSDELLIAAVDGELVNKALDRLSVRHRHVLAMREGAGWTYQQIADHEGVEIGTIETLLWRARQALKREFHTLSESKGALAGFLIGMGAVLRRGFLRTAHRASAMVPLGGTGNMRNALAGVAVTSAAVAAAFITPHAFSSAKPASNSSLTAQALSADPVGAGGGASGSIASPGLTGAASAGSLTSALGALSTSAADLLPSGTTTTGGGSSGSGSSGLLGGLAAGSGSGSSGLLGGLAAGSGSGSSGLLGGLTAGSGSTGSGLSGAGQSPLTQGLLGQGDSDLTSTVTNPVTGAITSTVTNPVTQIVTSTVTNPVTGAITSTVTNPVTQIVTSTVTNPVTGAITSTVAPVTTGAVTNTVPPSVVSTATSAVAPAITSTVTKTVGSVGAVLGQSSSTPTTTPTTTSTTTTTTPSVVSGTTKTVTSTVKNLLGG